MMRFFGLARCLLVIALSWILFAHAGESREHKDIKDLVMQGDARCTRCHSDVNDGQLDAYPVLPIGRTKHGTRADLRTPTCTSCHGDSAAHLKQKGEARPLPDRPFGKKAADPVAHNKACLSCHEGDKLMHWGGSIHARRDLPCSDCHRMHVEHDPATTREAIPEMCMSCHKEKRAQITRPSHHPIVEGKMVCTDCHNPHGSAGPKLMVKDSINETCYTCHMEYRGPFLWSHPAVRQDCSLCHNPHGTTTANLLKLRPPFLCQQCHLSAGHPSTLFEGKDTTSIPVAPATSTNANRILGRACTNCHVKVHGTNHPSGARLQR